MQRSRVLGGIVLLTQLAGCGFVHDEKIIGPYRLLAVDIDADMDICYALDGGGCIGRIGETVFAVGANARYIVAKQHPRNDRTKTNYFILDIAKDAPLAHPDESVIGPLSEREFLQRAKSLALPTFSKTIQQLDTV